MTLKWGDMENRKRVSGRSQREEREGECGEILSQLKRLHNSMSFFKITKMCVIWFRFCPESLPMFANPPVISKQTGTFFHA